MRKLNNLNDFLLLIMSMNCQCFTNEYREKKISSLFQAVESSKFTKEWHKRGGKRTALVEFLVNKCHTHKK